MSADRPSIIGPDSGPEEPYPVKVEGTIIHGYGRGSKELGIPTANIPADPSQCAWLITSPCGIYFGWAAILLPAGHPNIVPGTHRCKPILFPMVMSLGFNPYFRNLERSAEVHVLHKFTRDFYGAPVRLLILGFIRPEANYESLQALVNDIKWDCEVARNSLKRTAWKPKGAEVVTEGYEGDGMLDAHWLMAKMPTKRKVYDSHIVVEGFDD